MPIGPALRTAFQAAKGGLKSTGSAIGKPFDTLQSLNTGMRGRDMLKNPMIGAPAVFFGGAIAKDLIALAYSIRSS